VDHEKRMIVAYARFLQPGNTADVEEFVSGLNYLGYAPRSLRIVVGEHMQHTSDKRGD